MLIKGVQLWPFRGELQVFFAAALQTLATYYYRPKIVVSAGSLGSERIMALSGKRSPDVL